MTPRKLRRCPTCQDALRDAVLVIMDGRRVPLYPKPLPAQTADGHWFNFNEYRYYCGRCRMEFVYSTQDRSFTAVDPATAQHVFDPTSGRLVEAR